MTKIRVVIDRHTMKFRVALVTLIVAAIFILGWQGGNDYVTNLYSELIGVAISIGFTVVFVDTFYERRNREWETQSLKERLLRQAGSRVNESAVSAIEQLRHHGWLTGDEGLLSGADLWEARLHGAVLWQANLQQAVLHRSQLQESNLSETNLKGAELDGAQLQGAWLFMADLRGAHVVNANFERARFEGATLPDGSTWRQDIDLGRFVDRSHVEYKTTLMKINEFRRELGRPIHARYELLE